MSGAQTFSRSIELPVSAAEAFAWHERPGALERLVPPWEQIDVMARSGGIRNGGRVVLRQRVGPGSLTLEAEHFGYREGHEFNDRLVRGPFSRWEHRHAFGDLPGQGGSVLTDEIVYQAAGGPIGQAVVQAKLDRMFTYRHAVTAADLALWKRWAHRPRLRILVSGATGLVGGALCALLKTQGHTVMRLVRRAPRTLDEVVLSDLEAAAPLDAVVHLAGENVAGGRWTPELRSRILSSREKGTRELVAALGRLAQPPRVFVGASAIGFYGSRGDATLTETDGPGTGFLSEVCQAWERETMAVREFDTRAVCLRIGVVLSPAGGALAKLLPIFQSGAGGPVGDGRMWMSWISIDDLTAAIVHALMEDRLSGPVNAVAPEPVRNAEFSQELGQALGRPSLLPVPAFALRALYGRMADETLLASTRVRPDRLLETGFTFRHAQIRPALSFVLGSNRAVT
jgi:uncharacterized protein